MSPNHTAAWYAADCPPDFHIPSDTCCTEPAKEPAMPNTYTSDEAGTIFDGVHGQADNDCRVIELANRYGFPLTGPDATDVAAYGNGDADADTADRITMQGGLVDEAVDYLNEHATDGTATFEWEDGDFVLTSLEPSDDNYADMLDECYGEVNIAGLTYQTSRALRELDPIAYRCGYSDYVSSVLDDLRRP